MRSFALVLYYCIASRVPVYPRMFYRAGKWLRAALCRHIFAEVGRNVNIRPHVYFGNGRSVRIGDNSGLGDRCQLVTMSPITIGANVMIGPACMFLTGNHGYDDADRTLIQQDIIRLPITIEDDVWIGAGAIICPGAVVRSRTVVAAGSVVVGEIGPAGVYGGVPARLLKRIPELRAAT